MSEYKLCFTRTSSPATELCSNTESQWGWKEAFCRAEVRRDGGDGNQRAGGRQSPWEQGVAGTNHNSKLICPPTCQGHPDWQAQVLPGMVPSVSSGARFISNKVSQDNYRTSHSLSYKATYMQFWVFCLFAFSYPYPSTRLHKRHKLKVKYIRHCCILHWRC